MNRIPLFRVYMDRRAPEMVAETLRSGYIGQGKRVDEFERAFAATFDLPEPPLATNSCTAAIDLALHLIGVGPGDEVITTPITCTATNTHLVHRGATIVWADVDPATGLIDPADALGKVTPRTKAIIAVDWAGRPCDHAALRRSGVPIIQDAAHLPRDYRQRGDYVAWSFQAIKHLTTGDGGALLTPPGQMERGRLLRWYGLDRRSSADFRCQQDIVEAGYKYHMNDIAATIGLANLPGVRKRMAHNSIVAGYYNRELAGLDGIALPASDSRCTYWLYTLRVDDRDGFRAHMAERGIDTSPVHARNDKHPAFRAVAKPVGPLPGVDEFDAHQVSIPAGWWLSDADMERVIDGVRAWARRPVGVAR